jgi:hypothetical protein
LKIANFTTEVNIFLFNYIFLNDNYLCLCFLGRVNAIKFYAKSTHNERLKYLDIVSLYPYVCKYKSYPKKHCEVIRSNFNYQVDFYFGLIKCKVLPPSNLFHPVLPCKINGKLYFPLCYSCAHINNTEPCNHSDEERSLTAVWCTPELYKAVHEGYTILEIYQVYHYSERFIYIDSERSGLYGSYMNKWLGRKFLLSLKTLFSYIIFL